MGTDDEWTIAGNIFVAENGGGLANQCRFNIDSVVGGSGPLYIADNGNNDPKRTIYWNNPYNEYNGSIHLLGPAADRCRLTFSAGSRMNFTIGYSGMNNSISGIGTAVFDGDFYFDLWGASTNIGDSWIISSAAVQTFGSTFTVFEFNNMGEGLWLNCFSGVIYIFSENTAMLTVVPSPISVLTPNGDERYVTGKPVEIKYSYSGEIWIPTVDIEYTTDHGYSWYPIAYGTPNTGSYEWITPDVESEYCFVRINSTDTPKISDASDRPFIIFRCPEILPSDINNDCYVDLQDLALLAQNWLWCGDRFNPNCTIN